MGPVKTSSGIPNRASSPANTSYTGRVVARATRPTQPITRVVIDGGDRFQLPAIIEHDPPMTSNYHNSMGRRAPTTGTGGPAAAPAAS